MILDDNISGISSRVPKELLISKISTIKSNPISTNNKTLSEYLRKDMILISVISSAIVSVLVNMIMKLIPN